MLEPGAWSSQRHWHDGEDEFLVMLTGEAVLVEDEGRTVLAPRRLRGLAQGRTNGHHLINESGRACSFIVVGGGVNTGGGYSDIDMMWTADDGYVHKDGTPYPRPSGSLGRGFVFLDHPGLVLGLVDPFGDVRLGQDGFHVHGREIRVPARHK